ncbi:tRNA (N6-threonylcarbamoyladenosine(37)-N6)-methyltransferase TrmO [Prevotella sp. kh1p2]|uniref:tRNA (N6-threonylcarbamoyladenosine(37)-N6)-methyltransferase TrmO n=1 Tax=Prevotella sp. kh1p2 TaxID=1761883 RepID=UPI0008CB6286|nr:tRNA (N6-threonylcarbamoyladenosine(37)-N6)-methyltransferase TrmO [Prevotella sp. kh1p2]SET23180.1 tRNA-Thr(GGU) m(6)t(6)A37 methyltransferase TsaA [Prevotella sp. kh1p2]SNU12159.1 tRNA-Thr(GGU) m(6)t(6)A37 methyltransferase TsaA [Prevotellaceae bacterium KH2P17]
MELKPIATFRSPFTSKFGIPKQSNLVEELEGEIIFERQYRNRDALRGLDGFDYIWLIWEFSANRHAGVSPVVRPPVLGGNEKVGVFASRSPFRPNNIGLSCVRIDRIEWETSRGPVIHVRGADLMDGTPIYDIKPYVAYADSHPGARSGFVDARPISRLHVEIPDRIASGFSRRQLEALRKTLELDPRPHYQDDPGKVYGMPFMGSDIHFTVRGDRLQVQDD